MSYIVPTIYLLYNYSVFFWNISPLHGRNNDVTALINNNKSVNQEKIYIHFSEILNVYLLAIIKQFYKIFKLLHASI